MQYIGKITAALPLAALAALCAVTAQAQSFNNVPALAFTAVTGGANPLPQVVTLSSTTTNFAVSVTPSTSSGGSWLSANPTGTGCCETPEAVIVTATVGSLTPGTYTGQIVFAQYFQGNPTMTVPVTLTVTSASSAFFGDMAGQASFSMTTGGSAPPSQTIQVLNGGTGTLNWTITASTADGGSWLEVPVTSGTAPSRPSVGINPLALPGGGSTAGNFAGQLLFKASGSSVTVPVSVTVGASVLTQVNPVYLTMPQGGSNPLPQVLDVSSTGTNLSFTTYVFTGTGGSWLNLSNKGAECCTTPEALTVSVNGASLAAGTYVGEIVISQYFQNTLWMTVPVVLTVEPTGEPFFDTLPGELSFFQTSTETPAPQTLSIRNAGTGTLNWTATAATADGGKWLVLSAASGTAPDMLTVSIHTASLPGGGATAGTFDGQVVLQTGSDVSTIPVSVTVGASVFAQVNAISFSMLEGGPNPLPQLLPIASTGTNFTFSSVVYTAQGGSWLTISNLGGECCTTPFGMTVSVNGASLAPGTYTGEIVLTQYFQQTLGLTIPVTLTVVATGTPAYFDSLPGQLSFTLATGAGAPAAQPIQIRNAGSGSLHWTMSTTTADGGNWLIASALSGTAPSTVSISINPVALPSGGTSAGTYNGQLVLQGPGDTVTIPVSVTVGASVFVQVNPINFTMIAGEANPLPQVLSLASTNVNFTFSSAVYTGDGGSWLSISNVGAECCTTPLAMTVSVNGGSLAAGTYSGEIVLTQYFQQNMQLTVPVTLTVNAPSTAAFDNLPGQLTFFMSTTSTPPAQTIQVRNAGTGTLSWTVKGVTSDGGAWLTVTPASGKNTATVTVKIKPTALPGGGHTAGIFNGELVFTDGTQVATVPLAVRVGTSIFNQLNALNFVMPEGGANPLPQVLPVSSNGTNFTFTATGYNANGGNWLTLSNKGAECCTTPFAMTVSVNGASLAAGTYTGEITLVQYFQQDIWMTIPVTLTVVPCGPFFDSVPGQVSFSFAPSSHNPPNQTVQIRNAGSGTLNWTLSAVTADGGKWLSTSATTGAAPSTVTIGVKSASLPGGGTTAGNFAGELVFTSGSTSVSIPVSVIVAANTFTQTGSMNFSMTLGGSNPAPQNLAISSTGTNFTYSAAAYMAAGGAWLKISPTGSECCTTPDTITVSVTATSLPAGIYTGEIVLLQYAQQDLWTVVPVTLTVSDPRIPASITATGGTPQSVAVTQAFANPLSATVQDSTGNPVSGVLVTFNAPASGASGTFACSGNTALTNAAGLATSPVFTANTVAGAYTVTATALALTTNPGFALTNVAGPPASIVTSAGTPQTATVNTAFATKLAATVTDAHGNPVSGATVTFVVPTSGASGTFAGGKNTAKTNASGIATAAVFTANTVAGSYTVTAKVGAHTTSPGFLLTNAPGAPATITATGGTPQSAVINTAFALPLSATVVDSFSNPIAGVTVTFTAPGTGASGTFAGGQNTAVTGATGVATSAVFTANGTTGTYAVSGKAGSLTTSPAFRLTNQP